MKEFNKNIKTDNYTIGDVSEQDLQMKIYETMIQDLSEFIRVDEGYKMKTLDIFASESCVFENKPDWMDYKSFDVKPYYQRNNKNITIDIQSDPNNMAINPRTYDLIFVSGHKFGFGENHNSLPEVERIIKSGGLLIASLSKYLYFRELNQVLMCYRPVWQYLKSVAIEYKITESGAESSKYFCYYRYKA